MFAGVDAGLADRLIVGLVAALAAVFGAAAVLAGLGAAVDLAIGVLGVAGRVGVVYGAELMVVVVRMTRGILIGEAGLLSRR